MIKLQKILVGVAIVVGGIFFVPQSAFALASIPATLTYSCPAEYIFTYGLCFSPRYGTGSFRMSFFRFATYFYSCPAGYTLSGTSCIPPSTLGTITTTSNIPTSWTITGPATITGSGTTQTSNSQPAGIYTITWNAVAGYTTPVSQSHTLTAGGTISFNATYAPACTYSCPSGRTLSGTTCQAPTSCTYSCPAGYTLSSTTCYPPRVTPAPTKATPSCITPAPIPAIASASCTPVVPHIVSCPAGYTIVNGSCVAPVALPCTAPNVTTWSSCKSSALCTTPPSNLTGQSGFRTGICPTPTYAGTVIEACSSATVTCTAPLTPTLCGNGICETGETFLNCSKDCRSKVREF